MPNVRQAKMQNIRIMQRLAAEVEQNLKTEIELKLTRPPDYWRWLGKTGKKDNADSRAEFISM